MCGLGRWLSGMGDVDGRGCTIVGRLGIIGCDLCCCRFVVYVVVVIVVVAVVVVAIGQTFRPFFGDVGPWLYRCL